MYGDLNTAYLSNEGRYTIFRYGNIRLKFIGPYSLERYSKVVTWDDGYIVVMTKYKHNTEDEEEYIDLVSILNRLQMDKEECFKQIKKVEVRYD